MHIKCKVINLAQTNHINNEETCKKLDMKEQNQNQLSAS